MVEPTPSPVVAIAAVICGEVAAGFGRSIVRAVSGDTNDKRKELLDELKKNIESSSLPSDADIRPVAVREEPRDVPRRVDEVSQMKTLIAESISNLEQAKRHTKCNVCKTKLDEAAKAVRDSTKAVLRASDKWMIIQELKQRGDIPEDAEWKDLDEDTKKRINSMVINNE